MIDRVEIITCGGAGGAGCVSFRREKYVPRGGPDGGDGGAGGRVLLVSDAAVRTLKEIGRKRVYRAQRGVHGLGGGRHGRRGADLVMKVPRGTEVYEEGMKDVWEKVGDLVGAGQAMVVARGGLGGWGNKRFATAVNRAPRIAQRGQEGEERRLRLELKLLADVGLVGMPNAGKSTLLRMVSHARPRVAAYPFTTLEPVLGVVERGDDRVVIADVPGLIEGAHAGAGLGLDFLRHIERTRIIFHLVDGSRPQPLRDMDSVNEELRRYGRRLGERQQLVAVNKVDLPEVRARLEELRQGFAARGVKVLFMSGATGEGVKDAVVKMIEAMKATQGEGEGAVAISVQTRPLWRGVTVHRQDGVFCVEGERVVAFAEMMPVEQAEGKDELWRRLGRWGVKAALRKAGARGGDRVRLGRVELEWME